MALKESLPEKHVVKEFVADVKRRCESNKIY